MPEDKPTQYITYVVQLMPHGKGALLHRNMCLHATDGRATGMDTGVALATLSDWSQKKIVVFVRWDNSECQYILE